MSRPLRVLIVEDDPSFRASFARAVESAADMVLTGACADLPEGLSALQSTQPDVVLVDIGLPSGSGIELIRWTQAHLPECEAMVITVFGDERHVIECLEAGASGYLLKDANDLALAKQIRTLCSGGSPISPVIARQLLSRLVCAPDCGDGPARGGPTLSEQERNTLELCGKGYSYEEVAQLMGRSRHTIVTHVKRIYRKLQVHSKAEALHEARRLGLVRD